MVFALSCSLLPDVISEPVRGHPVLSLDLDSLLSLNVDHLSRESHAQLQLRVMTAGRVQGP